MKAELRRVFYSIFCEVGPATFSCGHALRFNCCTLQTKGRLPQLTTTSLRFHLQNGQPKETRLQRLKGNQLGNKNCKVSVEHMAGGKDPGFAGVFYSVADVSKARE